jgi:hypothetical protein
MLEGVGKALQNLQLRFYIVLKSPAENGAVAVWILLNLRTSTRALDAPNRRFLFLWRATSSASAATEPDRRTRLKMRFAVRKHRILHVF